MSETGGTAVKATALRTDQHYIVYYNFLTKTVITELFPYVSLIFLNACIYREIRRSVKLQQSMRCNQSQNEEIKSANVVVRKRIIILFFNLNSAGDHRSLGGPGRGSSGWSEEFICVCIRCESKEEFKGITNFSEHMLTFHLDVGIVCPVCDKQPFNSKKLLKTHLILHTDRKACCPVSTFTI